MYDEKHITKTDMQGVFILEPNAVFKDFRGKYFELFNTEFWAKHFDLEFVQDDFSTNRKGTIRGFHGDSKTHKLVTCISGAIQLNIVDPRDSKSATFTLYMDGENLKQVLIPAGCGTGFQALEDHTIFHYKQTTAYDRSSQFTIKWDDERFDPVWPLNNRVLSLRDA